MNNKLRRAVFANLIAIVCLFYFVSCGKNVIVNRMPIDTCHVSIIADSLVPATPCVGDGSVFITASGNDLMFKLGSSGVYQAADSFKNITAGTYTVYVKDSTGCVISADITITSAAGSITATSTPTSACGYSGYIYITASGTGPFMYKLNNGIYQVSGTFSNLAAGTYIAYAKDGSGCERVTNVTVGTSGGSCPSY